MLNIGLDHPLGLWRRTKAPSETGVTTHGANGHAVSGIEQGDLIFADFDQALRSVRWFFLLLSFET